MGATNATDLPVTSGAAKRTHPGNDTDGFIAKFSAAGILGYATYFGGSAEDLILSTAGADDGSIFVVGTSTSTDFPVSPGMRSRSCAGRPEIFLAKFTNSGSLVFSTFLNDCITVSAGTSPTTPIRLRIAVDLGGRPHVTRSDCTTSGLHGEFLNCNSALYIAGSSGAGVQKLTLPGLVQDLAIGTNGKDYSVGAQFSCPGLCITRIQVPQAILLTIDPISSTIQTTTLSGVASGTTPSAVGIDAAGSLYVTGRGTVSGVSPNAAQSSGSGFVLKYDPQAMAVSFATYVGGASGPDAMSIAVTRSGGVIIAGTVTGATVPVAGAVLQPRDPGGENSGYFARLSGTGTAILDASFTGGSGADTIESIALDNTGNLFMVGTTDSANFPSNLGVPNPIGSRDYTYLTRVRFDEASSVDLGVALTCDATAKTSAVFACTVSVANNGPVDAEHVSVIFDIPSSDGVISFLSCTSSLGSCSGSGASRGIRVASLVSGGTFQSVLKFQVTKSTGATTSLSPRASIASFTGDSQPGNNLATASISVVVVPTASLTITSNPVGLPFSVGGAPYVTPIALQGAVDQSAVISWPATQPSPKGPGSRFQFAGWTDGRTDNPRTLSYANATFTAFYRQQYFLDVSVQGGGNASLESGWFIDGESLTLTARPKPCYAFDSWLGSGPGSYTGRNATITIGVLGPLNETAVFLPVERPCSSPDQIVNGASFRTEGLAPGAIITIFGVGFSSTTTTAPTGFFVPWPNALGDVVVMMNGKPIPIYFVSPTQINGQIPYDIPLGQASLVVSITGKQASDPVLVQLKPSGAGIFDVGGGRAAALNEDYSLNTSQNASRPGAAIAIFMTGQGLLDSNLAAGQPAPLDPLAHPILPVTATMGGKVASVEFAGLAAGYVGLLQVNLRIPADVSGDVPVAIKIGDSASNTPLISVAPSQ